MGIIGDMGAGKTLTCTVLAVRHIIKFQGLRPIYTNYHLDEDAIHNYLKNVLGQDIDFEWNYIADPMDFNNIKGGYAGLDEAWVWADCRLSQTKMNRFVSWIIIKSRKRDMDIIYTTQMLGQVDKRIRKLSDLIAVPNLNERTGMAKVTILANHSYVPIKFLKYYAPYYYPMYDTSEEIVIPDEEAMFEKKKRRKREDD